MRRERVTMRIREANADPVEIAGYFAEIARSLDERPRRLTLVLDSTVPVVFDIDGEGYSVSTGESTHPFSLRQRWLPEHPVPFRFGACRCGRAEVKILEIVPTTGNRFRVSDGVAVREMPVWWILAATALAVTAVITLHPIPLGLLAVLVLCATICSIWRHLRRPAA